MKRKRYTEEQIISILKEHEAGAAVPDLARKYAVAENTIYRWKSKYGGMEVSEAKRLRELETENAKLKRLLAEAELDKAALKELVEGAKSRTAMAAAAPWRSAPMYGIGPTGLQKSECTKLRRQDNANSYLYLK